ncbi:DUF885 domain-containing protein [Desertivirga arenae]|uniref:DUF885 domain-containing protein n=1 Tax=Desertivirga arenae TaxID=2810309 RepID=UPI001A97A023|nr:DUF885 domain-containing protein [Pedobacter sp. SYSU D00823]
MQFTHINTYAQIARNTSLYEDFEAFQKEKNRLYYSGIQYESQLLLREGTKAFVKEEMEFYLSWQRRLAHYESGHLSMEDQLSLIALKDLISRELAIKQCRPELLPVNQYSSWMLKLPEMAQGNHQSFKTITDYQLWLNKMLAFKPWTKTAMENMREGIKLGIVLPKVIVLKVIAQIDSITNFQTSVFYAPLSRIPGNFPEDVKLKLKQDYDNAIRKTILPSYRKFRVFLSEEYLPAASLYPGLSGVKDGRAMYPKYMYYYTGLELKPEGIYEIGLNEFKRITGELSSLREKAGFEGSNQEMFLYMKRNPQFTPFKTVQEVLLSYKAISDKVINKLPVYFTEYENINNDLKIKGIPSYRLGSAPPYYDNNTFYVPLGKPEEINTTGWPMEALFLHEAIPGHHFQLSLQTGNKELPSFRRYGRLPIFVEGWGLYSESLGDSLGCYQDIWQKIGAKGFELHRAIRLLVDVGLHTGKMTREHAIKLISDNEALPADIAELEVDRYMVLPGQALSYKLGEMKIIELRNKYQKLLGGKFKLSDFHYQLLKNGSIPFSAVELSMDDWAKKLIDAPFTGYKALRSPN